MTSSEEICGMGLRLLCVKLWSWSFINMKLLWILLSINDLHFSLSYQIFWLERSLKISLLGKILHILKACFYHYFTYETFSQAFRQNFLLCPTKFHIHSQRQHLVIYYSLKSYLFTFLFPSLSGGPLKAGFSSLLGSANV